MFCGYNTVYDYCNDKYEYTYANLIENNGYAVPDTGIYASVNRYDASIGQTILLEYPADIPLQTCDIDDNNQGFNNWDCYQEYLNNGGTVQNPSLEEYKLAQNDIIEDNYQNLLDAGILITIDNFVNNMSPYQDGAYVNIAPDDLTTYSIHLPSAEEDVINFSNILSQATLINAANSDASLTPLVDYYNVAHFLNYLNLVNILSNYFNKLKTYTTIKNNLLNDLQFAQSISDVQKLTFYGYKPSSKSNAVTDITTANAAVIKSNIIETI